MFAGGFDFSFPAVNRFDRGGVDVDAGGEVFLEEGVGDFAGFGESGAGYEDQAKLGGRWHGLFGGIVAEFGYWEEEDGFNTESVEERTQRARRREAKRRQTQEHKQEYLCHRKPQEGRALRTDSGQASPAPTRIGRVTVECGDYGYYTVGVGD
jgi:hypothetical protein